MKETIKNNFSKYISIFLLLSPIIDLLIGITRHISSLNITVGVIKLLFLVFIVYVYLFVFKKKKLLPIYIIIGIYFLMYTLGIYLFSSSIIFNVVNTIKILYFPILLITLYELKDHIKISNMTIFTMIYLYIILIFIPILFNMGYDSYKITKVGSTGLYNSANEISGLIAISTPIMFIIFKENRKVILNTILIFIYLFIISTIGTKTPLLSLIITLLISFIYILIKSIKNSNYKPLVISNVFLILIIIISILVIPKTNFYKNINTHINYLNIDEVEDVVDPKITDHLIFSQRLTFLKNRIPYYRDSNMYSKLFGTGFTHNDKVLKTVEIDYFDIYISLGLIGFILVLGIFIYVLSKTLKSKKIKTYNDLMYLTSILLIIILSFFTGHILTAPSVSILVVILLLNINRKKKDLLFAAVNLDLGGIEKALLNLVNRIDSNKYNIEIVLEEKKGIFLDQINNNIVVRELKVSNNKNVLLRKIYNYLSKLIYKIFNYHKYDFSCCYATYSYSSSKMALISSLNNAFYVHNDYRTIYQDDNDFYKFFNSREINNYKNIIFVSNENRKGFIQKYSNLKDRCLVFNNFINTDEIIKLSKEKIKETKPKNNKLFMFIGRLDDKAKKVSRQINLINELDNCKLWIIGDGPDKDKYVKEVKDLKITDKVLFLGRKKNPYPYMRLADYIILTSDFEGFPVTYLEAITLNKNIVTTFPTSDDVVDINKYGYVISKDHKTMVKEVKKIIKETKEVEKIDLEIGQINRMKELEKIFDEVV